MHYWKAYDKNPKINKFMHTKNGDVINNLLKF